MVFSSIIFLFFFLPLVLLTVPLKSKSVLVFGDSYCDKLLPLFKKYFGVVTIISDYYNKDVIDKIDPDVVISANVERNISL